MARRFYRVASNYKRVLDLKARFGNLRFRKLQPVGTPTILFLLLRSLELTVRHIYLTGIRWPSSPT